MEQIRAIIVDDEAPARLMVRQLVGDYVDDVTVIAEAANGRDAVTLINRLKPNLVFMDIEMPDQNGFEVLAKLDYQPMVIFITAYDQFAIHAFKENAIDYLVKPVDEERFRLTIDKIKRYMPIVSYQEMMRVKTIFEENKNKPQPTAIPIHLGNKIKLVSLAELCYIKADSGYLDLVSVSNEVFVSDKTLTELEEFLPSNFIRVQRSFILNKDKVEDIKKHFNGRYVFYMQDKLITKITSGKSYKANLKKLFTS